MIKWGKKVTKGLKTKLIWVNHRAEDLEKLQKKLGSFKIATFCRSFVWVEREKVLKILDNLIEEDGGVAIFGDKSFWNGEEKWQKEVKRVIQKYLGEERRAGEGKFVPSEKRWEDYLKESAFKWVEIHQLVVKRGWNVKSIIGYLFSTSFAAPRLFGKQLGNFKKEVRNTLLSLNPKGEFEERAVWTIILGSRKPFR